MIVADEIPKWQHTEDGDRLKNVPLSGALYKDYATKLGTVLMASSRSLTFCANTTYVCMRTVSNKSSNILTATDSQVQGGWCCLGCFCTQAPQVKLLNMTSHIGENAKGTDIER